MLSRQRRLLRIASRFCAFGLVGVIFTGVAGWLIRDRSALLAILMYLPVVPAGAAAVAIDLAMTGRALPRMRFGLAIVGLLGGALAALPMTGSGTIGDYGSTDTEVTLLHWNVLWGGGPFRSQRTWAAQRTAIINRDPDIVILSELPPTAWLQQLVDELGVRARIVGIEHDPRSRYWYRLGVCSRWPIHEEDRMVLPGGVALSATAEVRGRPLRLLAVDGRSNPFSSRLPFLHALAQTCRAAAEAGRPFDIVAGDFNTPSRSIGFDSLADQGYSLAGRSAAGWRATYPCWLPIYDIDHVWVGRRLRLRSCTFFAGPASDHRGQFVSLLLNKPEAMGDKAKR